MHLYSRSKFYPWTRYFGSDTLHPTLWTRLFRPDTLDSKLWTRHFGHFGIIFGPDTSRVSKLVATCFPFKKVGLAVKGKHVKLREY